MIKVRILDRSEFCEDEIYIFESQSVDSRGEVHAPQILCAFQVSFNRVWMVFLLNLTQKRTGPLVNRESYRHIVPALSTLHSPALCLF